MILPLPQRKHGEEAKYGPTPRGQREAPGCEKWANTTTRWGLHTPVRVKFPNSLEMKLEKDSAVDEARRPSMRTEAMQPR